MLSLPMRARVWAVTALALAAAAGRGVADEHEPVDKYRRTHRLEWGVDFAIGAAMGSVANPRIRSLAGNSPADTEKAIQDLVKRLRAERERLMPAVDRLDALRASYPQADDLSRFESERADLWKTIGVTGCRPFLDGTDLLHELIQARVAGGLPSFMATGKVSGDTGSYVSLWESYRSYEELIRVREQLCRVTTDEPAAFGRRLQELELARVRRVRLLWAGAAAAGLAAVAAWRFWRSRAA